MEKKKSIKRRKFFVLIGVVALGIGWLRNYFKPGSGGKSRSCLSLHPARFYQKLFSASDGGKQ